MAMDEEYEDFEDRVDEVTRLITGLKDGSLPADYVDRREKEIYDRESKKQEEKDKAKREEEERSFDKLPKERQDELLRKVDELQRNKERKERLRAAFRAHQAAKADEGASREGTDYQAWDLWTPSDEEDELYDVVGLLDHGAPGRFCLLKSVGDGDVDLKDLEKDDPKDESLRSFFDELGDLIEEEGRLDLLGCSVAASAEGLELIAALEELTGVTVAASVDQTGGAPDADWEMETEDLTVAADYFDEVQLAEWKEAAFVITGTVAAAALVTGIIGGVGKAVGEEATKAGVKAIKKKSKKSRRSPKSKKKAKPRATRKKRRGKKKKKRS